MKFIATSLFIFTVGFSHAQQPKQAKTTQTDSLEMKMLNDYGMRLYNPSLCYCPRKIDTTYKWSGESPYKFVNDKDTINPSVLPEKKKHVL
jgi:hypothetical protein